MAAFLLFAPVPPFSIANIPVTPGVISVVPLKEVPEVEAKFIWIVLSVANLVAVSAFPFKAPTNLVAYTLAHLREEVPKLQVLLTVG